jgi:hypothetical protein
MASLRRGQVFAISWRQTEDLELPEKKEDGENTEDRFGLFRLDWHLDHCPGYAGPKKRLMAVHGLLHFEDNCWPKELRIVLDVKDITNIRRSDRYGFNILW